MVRKGSLRCDARVAPFREGISFHPYHVFFHVGEAFSVDRPFKWFRRLIQFCNNLLVYVVFRCSETARRGRFYLARYFMDVSVRDDSHRASVGAKDFRGG